jgi:capsular exopolysaccharide synthesis family protein
VLDVPLANEFEEEGIDLRRVWAVIWLRAPLIIALVVIAAVSAYLLSSMQTNLYRATSKIRVVDPNAEAVFNGVQIRVDPKRDVDTQLQLIRSNELGSAVKDKLGDDGSKIKSVSASSVGATDLISITVSSTSPEVAQAAANAFAELYVAQRKDQVTGSFTSRADELRSKALDLDEQIKQIDNQLGDKATSPAQADVLRSQRATLVAQQADFQTRATQFDIEASTRSGTAEVAETAPLPSIPYSPTPKRDAALAAILALFVGVGLAFLLVRLDNGVRTVEDIEALAGDVTVLGGIPIASPRAAGARKVDRHAMRALVPLDSTAAEAYRALASNLRFSALGAKRTRILVTSAEGAEGKSTVVANLAMVLAESGQRVVIVSADLRKPSIGLFFRIDETAAGLTTVLLGDQTLDDAMHPVVLPSGRRMAVLPTGPLPQNPAELVGSSAMGALLDRLESAGADFILIDSPPLLPVADSLALSQFCDGAVVLALVGETPKNHLKETLERLKQVNTHIIGVVLNGVPTKGRYSRYYGSYSYGSYNYKNSEYSSSSTKAKPGPSTNGAQTKPRGSVTGPV